MTKRGKLLKRFGIIVVAALFIMALAGCSQASTQDSNENQNAANSTKPTETITLNDEAEDLTVAVLGKDIKIAALIVAYQEGFMEEEGLNINFETVANFSDGIAALTEHRMDVLPFGSIPTCTFVAQGEEDLCVFGGTIAEGSECVVLPENKDKYVTLDDFADAKIGYFPMETGHLVMQGLQAENGTYNPDNWVLLASTNEIMQAVLKGEVDCGFVNSGQGYIAAQQGLTTSMQVGTLQPDFPCCRQTTSMYDMENKTSALAKFVIAELRGLEFMQTNKEQAIKDLADYSGQSEEYCEAVIYGNADYDTPMIVEVDPYTDAVCEFYGTMKATQNIDPNTPYKMEDHVDSSIYKFALDTLIARGQNASFYNDLLATYEQHNTIGR